MKLEKLVGERFKERPADCVVDSHAIMTRGGYIKYVANGIYSSFMPLKRVTKKIEKILREEMDAIDGQEVQFPVVMPASLWEESGRYNSIAKELVRFSDRNDCPMVLGMTHEEAAVQLVREYAQSYNRYPFMIYQIQTKFRDEARPKSGLIRVREFTMKDAYSFHTSQADLEEYYAKCLAAYEKIYRRVGLPEVISVASDSGMMGGSVSHEFMFLTPIGEDTIVMCPECGYRANMEAAACIYENKKDEKCGQLEMVATPGQQTIADVCNYLRSEFSRSCKAVVYQRNKDDSFVVVFTRGDVEINENKLTKLLGCELHPAVIDDACGLKAGFIGPYKLGGEHTVIYDISLKNVNNLICGANVEGYHYRGLDIERDIGHVEYHDIGKAAAGGICPVCGRKTLTVSKGIEVGNIFQLGTKYTKSMNMTYVDKDGNLATPIMGCYGIGVGRLAASICEAHHDENGPIWPISVAPWQVHLCAVRPDDEQVKIFADRLYSDLQNKGIEIIYDDRKISAGVMFADADLIGAPVRVVVSPRNLKQNIVEVSLRDKSASYSYTLENAQAEILKLVENLKNQYLID